MSFNAPILAPRAPSLSARPGARWGPVLAAVAVWLAAGFSVAYWVLRAWGPAPLVPLPVVPAPPVAVDSGAVARALGAPSAPGPNPVAVVAPAAAPAVYRLLGVVAPAKAAVASDHAAVGQGAGGVALIASEGQPPRPYRVGAVLDGRWRVQAVHSRTAVLVPLADGGPNAAALTLTLPDSK